MVLQRRKANSPQAREKALRLVCPQETGVKATSRSGESSRVVQMWRDWVPCCWGGSSAAGAPGSVPKTNEDRSPQKLDRDVRVQGVAHDSREVKRTSVSTDRCVGPVHTAECLSFGPNRNDMVKAATLMDLGNVCP